MKQRQARWNNRERRNLNHKSHKTMTKQEVNKLSSTHLRRDSLVEHALQVCYAIEVCGASPQLTHAVVLASALHSRLQMLASSPSSVEGCEAEYKARLADYKRSGSFHDKQAAVAALNAWEEALSAGEEEFGNRRSEVDAPLQTDSA